MHITGHTSETPSLCYPVGKHVESSTSEKCSENEMRAKFPLSISQIYEFEHGYNPHCKCPRQLYTLHWWLRLGLLDTRCL
jgi:hypothetical protein